MKKIVIGNRAVIIITFFSGLFIGFLVGGTLVYRQYQELISGHDSNTSFNKLIRTTNNLIGAKEKDSMAIKPLKAIIAKAPTPISKNQKIIDSLMKYDENFNAFMNKVNNGEIPDSMLRDSMIKIMVGDKEDDETIIIKKEILLSSIKVEITGVDAQKNRKNQYLDSLLTDDKSAKSETSTITVEFWDSPLNYKGYKMSRNKLILYGLEPSSEITLRKLNNIIYLKYADRYFQITYTDNFAPYQAITNEQIIKQLKS